MSRGEDVVTETLEQANALFEGKPSEEQADAFLVELDQLDSRTYVSLDERSRGWSSGLRIPRKRPSSFLPWRQDPLEKAWPVLALMSGDGFQRELAVAACNPGNRGEAALLLIRSTDWVEEVQLAAEKRFSRLETAMLIELLPLADHLAESRYRTGALTRFLQERLDADILREAAGSSDPDVRRVGVRMFIESGAPTFDELRAFLRVEDPMTRAKAAAAVLQAPAEQRRAAAEQILKDPVGWIAARALAALVELDGHSAIRRGLDAGTATVRRHAIGWANARNFDARGHYLNRLRAAEPELDQDAVCGLAALADPEDEAIFLAGLNSGRARVKAGCLRALCNVNTELGRDKAVEVLLAGTGGRVAAVAASILREHAVTAEQREALVRLVEDPEQAERVRWRVLTTLRRYRWLHLATTLNWIAGAEQPTRTGLENEVSVWLSKSSNIGSAPPDELRPTIESGLWGLNADQARAIEFILRTTR